MEVVLIISCIVLIAAVCIGLGKPSQLWKE